MSVLECSVRFLYYENALSPIHLKGRFLSVAFKRPIQNFSIITSYIYDHTFLMVGKIYRHQSSEVIKPKVILINYNNLAKKFEVIHFSFSGWFEIPTDHLKGNIALLLHNTVLRLNYLKKGIEVLFIHIYNHGLLDSSSLNLLTFICNFLLFQFVHFVKIYK